jgi:hypothetical protein
MKELITITARIILAVQRAYIDKWRFLLVFLFVFVGDTLTLARLDLLPSITTKVEAGIPVVDGTKTQTLESSIP